MTDLTHRYARVGHLDIHYVEAGDGPLVVLLHGFPEFWYSWRHQIPALVAAGFRVIAPDLRGYNESSKPPSVESYRIAEVVRDVAGLIAQSGDVPCAVVGHDWGGVVAWYLPMIHPEQVSKLIMLNSPHPVPLSRELRRSTRQKLAMTYQLYMQPPKVPEFFMRRFRFAILRRALRRLAKRPGAFTDADLDRYVDAWRQRGALTAMTNYYRALRTSRGELRQLVRRIDIPTLLIWGLQDPVFLRETTENFGDWVTNLRVERLAEAGHFVQSDEPERVNALMVEFLRSTP